MRTHVYLYLIWITLLWNVANKTQIYVHTYLCIIHDTHATLWNTPYPYIYILFETICIIRTTQKTHVSVLGCSSFIRVRMRIVFARTHKEQNNHQQHAVPCHHVLMRVNGYASVLCPCIHVSKRTRFSTRIIAWPGLKPAAKQQQHSTPTLIWSTSTQCGGYLRFVTNLCLFVCLCASGSPTNERTVTLHCSNISAGYDAIRRARNSTQWGWESRKDLAGLVRAERTGVCTTHVLCSAHRRELSRVSLAWGFLYSSAKERHKHIQRRLYTRCAQRSIGMFHSYVRFKSINLRLTACASALHSGWHSNWESNLSN